MSKESYVKWEPVITWQVLSHQGSWGQELCPDKSIRNVEYSDLGKKSCVKINRTLLPQMLSCVLRSQQEVLSRLYLLAASAV